MSDHKFVTYQRLLMNRAMDEMEDPDDFDEYILKTQKQTEDPEEMALHYINEAQLIPESLNEYKLKDLLLNSAKNALAALSGGDINEIALCFYSLGKFAERACHPSDSEMIKLREASYQRELAYLPLKRKNDHNSALKKIAQDLSREIWELDRKKEIMLIDMCHKIWAFFADNRQEIPLNEPSMLKAWLRPVAKEFGYPSKQGRPKRKK